jgi:hypothetical protein
MITKHASKKYGRLSIVTVLNKYKVIALCDCGTEKEYWSANIRSGKTMSCGCFNRQKSSERFKKLNLSHGLSSHPLYSTYNSMISRCYDINDISFKRYGGRGIMVCDEWRNEFTNFYNWAVKNGWQDGLQLDKDIKGNGKNLYSPDTCRFVTRKINCRNRRSNKLIEYSGETKTLAEWCEIFNIKNHSMVLRRITRGWSIEKALLTPAKNNGYAKP